MRRTNHVSALRLDFPLDRRQAQQHCPGIGGEGGVGGERIEIGQRPADIARDDVEQRPGGRREEADVELHVEEQRRDIGAVEDVLQIVGGGALPIERFLQLAIEGGQLLVERLQFFLRGQQFLVGRLEFLVDRQSLFVDRLLLFAGNFEVVDRALQLGPGRFQLMLELGDAGDVEWRAESAPSLRSCGCPSTKQISISCSPSTGTGWTSMSNETATPSRSNWPPGTTIVPLPWLAW